MPVTSNRGAVEDHLHRGLRAGVTAAAIHYRNAMQVALRGGYKSGRFYSGMQGVAGSVRHTDATEDEGGAITAHVGTNVPYAKWWELGHHNLFLRGRWVRAERWRPTLLEEAPAMARKFAAAARLTGSVGDLLVTRLVEPEE